MGKTARDKRPHVRPVQKIELHEKHLLLRVILFVVFLVVGISLIVFGISRLFAGPDGWQTVEADTSEVNCAADFVLQYEFGTGDLSSKKEYAQLSAFYGEATAKAYRLFHETDDFNGVHNVAYLNAHPNESVTVDWVLYDALAKMNAAGSRQLFLAPIWVYYDVLFSCTEDAEVADYDPILNGDIGALFTEILRFANDPAAISLDLGENNSVCLSVSEEYRRFAEEHEIYTFFGFHWMKNAFIVDYLAQTLQTSGFMNGSVSSYDGFTRNLDRRGISYSFNLFDRVDNTVYNVGTMAYTKPLSIVSLRTFPLSSADADHYYILQSGETRFPYVDMTDGICRAAQNNLVCYAENMGCADLLLCMIPVYIGDGFDPAPLIETDGIEFVYSRGGAIWHSEEALSLQDVASGYATKKITE